MFNILFLVFLLKFVYDVKGCSKRFSISCFLLFEVIKSFSIIFY